MMEADVLVLGGGSAGLAAAVMASRRGARTVLVERHGFAGGMGTASLVHTFCGLYLAGTASPVIAHAGFPAEMEQLARMASGQEPVQMGRLWVLMQHPAIFASLADRLLREAGVHVLFHTEAVRLAALPDGGWQLGAVCRGQFLDLHAAALVDASGDAVAAGLLGGEGAEMTASSRLQRPAFIFGLCVPDAGESSLPLAARIAAGVRTGDLPAGALGLQFRSGICREQRFGTIDLSAGEENYDPLDPAGLSLLEQTGREIAVAAVAYLSREAPGWAGAWISQWPSRVGVRESRRWKGRSVLAGSAILAGTRQASDIALATWPLEFRENTRGPRLQYAEGDRPAGIPLGCLRPAGLDTLFTAGRCISCDHEAQASVRVMGTCFATGQAAGVAAAMKAAGEEPQAGAPGLEVPADG